MPPTVGRWTIIRIPWATANVGWYAICANLWKGEERADGAVAVAGTTDLALVALVGGVEPRLNAGAMDEPNAAAAVTRRRPQRLGVGRRPVTDATERRTARHAARNTG